jgi:hypothetical protein
VGTAGGATPAEDRQLRTAPAPRAAPAASLVISRCPRLLSGVASVPGACVTVATVRVRLLWGSEAVGAERGDELKKKGREGRHGERQARGLPGRPRARLGL